jgi:CRISPR-associated protein Csb1
MSQETNPTPEQIKAINDHLDALLGMDVRKPGTAAKLPAVIRITETLEPAGGKDFPVFPPSYAGEGTNAPPVYDLNGIEWGEVLREKLAKDGTKRITRYIKRARHCTMDSPQSHANRTEIAFRDDSDLLALVPQAEAKIPRKPEFAGQSNTSLLALPHRVADFRVRASNQKVDAAKAINAFANGNALPLLRFMPTSIVFGFWDSRAEGYQHKHSRILLSRIDAFDVVPCEKRSLYTGPYSKDECASVVLGNDNLAEELSGYDAKATDDDEKTKASNEAKKWADKMAERGFSNALGSGLGGIFAERIERLALISLTDISSIFCHKPDSAQSGAEAKSGTDKKAEPDKKLTNAARRYLLALALLAEGHPRSIGSYRLRSGCELLPSKKETVLLGAGLDSDAATALKSLCDNRELLIAVAKAAHEILEIKSTPVPECPLFESTAASLKGELEQGRKAKKGKAAIDKPKQGAKGKAPAEELAPAETEAAADEQQN